MQIGPSKKCNERVVTMVVTALFPSPGRCRPVTFTHPCSSGHILYTYLLATPSFPSRLFCVRSSPSIPPNEYFLTLLTVRN